jgi:HK97 family phage prohead protease
MTIEYRSFTAAESVEATDEGHVFGLAIPYSRRTTIGNMDHGGFREEIAPGACNKSLREADIVALNNHNSWQPLGRTSAGNLTLKSTTRGVEPDLEPIDTSYGDDLIKNVKAGIVRGWSFGFEVIKDEWTRDGEPSDEYSGTDRTIREMKLIEVSPVTFPAYDQTEISARSRILAEREARQADSLAERAGDAPGDGSKPYGNVPYADPGYQKDGKKRYPLDTKKHAQAAWSYVNQADNASVYNSEQLAAIKGRIKSALKKFGVDVSEENEADLAEEWRAQIEAKKAAKRAAKEARAAVPVCPNCGADMSCVDCTEIPKPDDPNVSGAQHGVSGTANALTLNSADPSEETRDSNKSDDLSAGTAKRVPQIVAELQQALKLFGEADVSSLPKDAQTAVALVSSAVVHASHIQDHEGLEPADAAADGGRAAEPKPAESTSADLPDDNALILARLHMISRDVELGL